MGVELPVTSRGALRRATPQLFRRCRRVLGAAAGCTSPSASSVASISSPSTTNAAIPRPPGRTVMGNPATAPLMTVMRPQSAFRRVRHEPHLVQRQSADSGSTVTGTPRPASLRSCPTTRAFNSRCAGPSRAASHSHCTGRTARARRLRGRARARAPHGIRAAERLAVVSVAGEHRSWRACGRTRRPSTRAAVSTVGDGTDGGSTVRPVQSDSPPCPFPAPVSDASKAETPVGGHRNEYAS